MLHHTIKITITEKHSYNLMFGRISDHIDDSFGVLQVRLG